MFYSALSQIAVHRCIYKKILSVLCFMVYAGGGPQIALAIGNGASHTRKKEETTHSEKVVLWRHPGDIRSRDLFYGQGGKAHAPNGRYKFLKEDLNGTNPKLHVVDEQGVKWRVKLGAEARPEIAASRLLWAVGYSTNEFYFLPALKIDGLPAHLHRGQNLVGPDGILRAVDMKRLASDEDKLGEWRWRRNPFSGTREFNGLRVMMALLNNWDLKNDNNAVYQVQRPGGKTGIYRVADLGATFGFTGASWRIVMQRGGVRDYSRSRFISKVTSDYVDFNVPTRPALVYIFNPLGLIKRMRLRWIGRRIPRADARWVGQILSQLSEEQIRDAFRAGGYNPEEVEEYTHAVEKRIGELSEL